MKKQTKHPIDLKQVRRRPSLTPPSPDQCAAYADIALNAYLDARGSSGDTLSDFSDLLTDLAHWAKENELDFGAIAASAEVNAESE